MELYSSNTTVSSPSTTTTTTTTFLMGAASNGRTIRANATLCASSVATTTSCGNAAANDGAGYAYHVHSQSQAIIYIVVILVLYFSALTVLIVRYVTKERNQLRSNRSTLKKNRGGDRFFACPREIETSNMSTVSTQLMADRDVPPTVAPPVIVPHLSVSSPSMSLLIPPSIHHHMDTAV